MVTVKKYFETIWNWPEHPIWHWIKRSTQGQKRSPEPKPRPLFPTARGGAGTPDYSSSPVSGGLGGGPTIMSGSSYTGPAGAGGRGPVLPSTLSPRQGWNEKSPLLTSATEVRPSSYTQSSYDMQSRNPQLEEFE